MSFQEPILEIQDLILSGHMHGGAVPTILSSIMREKGFLAPANFGKNRFFPNHVSGRIERSTTTAIISTGITRSFIPFNDSIYQPNVNLIKIKRR